MTRLILLLILVAAVALTVTAVIRAAQAVSEVAAQTSKEGVMPNRFSKYTYILLLILLFSAAAGGL